MNYEEAEAIYRHIGPSRYLRYGRTKESQCRREEVTGDGEVEI